MSSSSISFRSVRKIGHLYNSSNSTVFPANPRNFAPRFASFSCFLRNGPFPDVLRTTSFGSLWITIQCLFFIGLIPLLQIMTDPSPYKTPWP